MGTEGEPRVFGEKNATKLLEALQRARTLPLARWILALAIPEIGEETAYDLANYFPDLPTLISSPLLADTVQLGELRRTFQENKVGEKEKDTLTEDTIKGRKQHQEEAKRLAAPIGRRLLNADFAKPAAGSSPKDWQAVSLMGPVAAKALVDWSTSLVGRQVLRRMKELGLSPRGSDTRQAKASGAEVGPLTGKKFVLIGTLTSMSRDEAAEKIRSLGGDLSNAVTKNTSFLVVGEEPGATKTDQAKALGVQQLTEEQFLAKLDLRTQPKSPRQQDRL